MANEQNRQGQGQGTNVGGTTGTTGGGMGGQGGGQGINEIRRQFENVDFPVSKNQLVDQVGTKTVNLGGKSINLREVLNKVGKDRFNSQDELMNELRNVPEMKNIGGMQGGSMGGTSGTQGGMQGNR